MKTFWMIFAFAGSILVAGAWAQTPLGSAFTYQGVLTDGNAPAQGSYDFVFGLYSDAAGTSQVDSDVNKGGVPVVDGRFTVALDFGPEAFVDEARWLRIGVRSTSAGGAYTNLEPIQPLTPAPTALYAATTDDLGAGWVLVDRDTGIVSLQNARLDANDTSGVNRGSFEVLEGGEGSLSLWGPGDSLNVDLSALLDDADLGFIGVGDTRGEIQTLLSIYDTGEGRITLWGPNDNVNVDISASIDDANLGYVGVADETGEVRAGIFIDDSGDGVVFGDSKQFIVDHPNRPGEKIVYVSLEGPEAAIFKRGVVKLENGRGAIELPEHFVALANPETLTVQLTPASIESLGVAFTPPVGGRIEVGELHGGTGSYDVHYVIHATRAGMENHQPVVKAGEMKARKSRLNKARRTKSQRERTKRQRVTP